MQELPLTCRSVRDGNKRPRPSKPLQQFEESIYFPFLLTVDYHLVNIAGYFPLSETNYS